MHRIPLSAIILFALLTYASIPLAKAGAQPQRMGIPGPKKLDLPDGAVVTKMLRFNELPMIEVMINDSGPYRLIVDTGAAGIVVRPKLAKKLELPSPPGMPEGMSIQVRTPGGPVPATIQYIDKIKIGKMSVEGIWTIATEMPFGEEMDGVIGMNLFKNCLMTYDYPKNQMIFKKGELPKPNGKNILSYKTPRMPDSHPVIDLNVNGKTHPALLDTGMRGWFAVPEKSKGAFKFSAGPVESTGGLSVGGKTKPVSIGRIDGSISLGQFKVSDPVVREMKGQYMIGTLFLQNFQLTFDGKNKRLSLEGRKDSNVTQPATRIVGFELKQVGDHMEVWYVHPKSHAAKLGLKVGDRVTKLNGHDAAKHFHTSEWRDLLKSNKSVAISVRAKSGEEDRKLTVEILELLKR